MRRKLFAACLAASLALSPLQSAHALFGVGDVVFDPTNYAENLLTATRTLTVINQQVQQLANEAQMLVNMAKHLERLDYSSAVQVRTALSQINLLMQRAEGLVYNVTEIEQEYARLYPEDFAALSNDDLLRDARQRWDYSRKAFAHALTVQAEVVNAVQADGLTLDQLIAQSQGAVGSLQATQAGNQLVALAAKQQIQTQELLAAQYRAEAIERARQIAAEEAAKARFDRFIGDGHAYTRQ